MKVTKLTAAVKAVFVVVSFIMVSSQLDAQARHTFLCLDYKEVKKK